MIWLTQRRIIQSFYQDLDNLVDVLAKTVNAYSILVGTADTLNKNPFASKSDIKETLERVDDLGDIMDDILDTLDNVTGTYLRYINVKSEAIKVKLTAETICLEIDEELKFKD